MKKGIECEGIYKGFQTLFVTDKDKRLTVINTLTESIDIHHVYVGADKTKPDFKLAESLVDLGYYVTVEVNLNDLESVPPALLGKVRFILSRNISGLFKFFDNLDMVKLEDDTHCYVFTKGSAIVNEKNYLDIPL